MWVFPYCKIFFFQSLIDILTKPSKHRKVIIPILKPKYKTLAVMYMVCKGYLWMHQSINPVFEFPLQSGLLTLELLFASFFPLAATVQSQCHVFVFQLHLFNYESVSQKKNKVIILQCEFPECLSGLDIWMKIMFEHINRKLELYCGFFESLECIWEDRNGNQK